MNLARVHHFKWEFFLWGRWLSGANVWRIQRIVVITCQIRLSKAREIASYPGQWHSCLPSLQMAHCPARTKRGSRSTLPKCPFHIISIISGSFAKCHQVTVTMQKQYTTTANAGSSYDRTDRHRLRLRVGVGAGVKKCSWSMHWVGCGQWIVWGHCHRPEPGTVAAIIAEMIIIIVIVFGLCALRFGQSSVRGSLVLGEPFLACVRQRTLPVGTTWKLVPF